MKTHIFSGRQDSVNFYENRYSHGYMGYWSEFEKNRLKELIHGLNLPKEGRFLDFGCGRGIFTHVIQEVLPGWKGYGCDISSHAIQDAKTSPGQIRFFVLGDEKYSGEKFDFIHSHHVLEHTYNAEATANEQCRFAAPACTMLHSFPCLAPGSLEYRVSAMMQDGIDPENGKFFFEDPAHLRRPSFDQAIGWFSTEGFSLLTASYANQYYGAIKWISESPLKLILHFTNTSGLKSSANIPFLIFLRIRLLFFRVCHFASTAFLTTDKGRYYFVKKVLQVILFVLFFWIALPASWWLRTRAIKEWREQHQMPNGTELFLALYRK
ncbi:MAG: class I SAM-dependent methyltransferase [Bacteroidia bacterium]|nr:class I SAM-dependent methyltransferase [Bacteroidia bacterium]